MIASGLIALCAGLAVAAPTARTIRIGAAPSGAPVEVIALGDPVADRHGHGREDRPALLIVAGLQAHHAIGRDAARALADRLLADHADLLATRTVYILPNANPDGAQSWSRAEPAKADFGRAPAVIDSDRDADRDGRTEEDPSDDLNGDGYITMMRVPAPNTRYGINATHIVDPDEPRLMRAAKAADGEAATHAILIEGIDNDNDGAFNEDGWAGASGGGVDLDRHFPTHWPEHTDGAGLYPLERPEARAIAEWIGSRPNIVAVLVYGPHDTLASVPPSGQFPPPGRVPSGIEEGDKAFYEAVSERYKEITGVTKAGDSPDRAGSFLQWVYADQGLYAFGSPVWTRPDLVKGEDSKKADAEPGAAESAPAEPADPAQAERDALLARGVPAEIAAFITMTPEERAAEMASFESRPASEVAALMAAVEALPAEIRARVMALAQGGEDPGPPAAAAVPSASSASSAPSAERPPARARNAKKNDSPDAKWLEWIDAERDGEGFIDWQPFDHPQLGPVEIGGFAPGVRTNPPDDAAAGLIDQQAEFVVDLIGKLPTLEVEPPTVERVGPSLWRIGVAARNTGFLPTVPAIGVKTRRLAPLVIALDPEQTIPTRRIVSGGRLARFASIDGSGAGVHASWLVVADEGEQIRIDVRSPRFGDRGFDVRLSQGQNTAAPADKGDAR